VDHLNVSPTGFDVLPVVVALVEALELVKLFVYFLLEIVFLVPLFPITSSLLSFFRAHLEEEGQVWLYQPLVCALAPLKF